MAKKKIMIEQRRLPHHIALPHWRPFNGETPAIARNTRKGGMELSRDFLPLSTPTWKRTKEHKRRLASKRARS